MRIIISPAKKMNMDTDSLAWQDLPQFIDRAEYLRDCLKQLSYEQLKQLQNERLVKQVQHTVLWKVMKNLQVVL